MSENNSGSLRLAIVGTIAVLLLLIYLPAPALSQQEGQPSIQDLIVNGGFEGGFQEEYGIGYGWGGFSNGNAVVGWTFDDWASVVAEGDYSQQIQIKDALDQNRYAGLYQTVSVVPGEQYKLSVTGMIRSEEGSAARSDYGYRLQYAVDPTGGTSWELIEEDAWREFPWDEQALDAPSGQEYDFDTFETTVTAESDQLTLFIRGWKKWINDGTGIFNIDDVSFVGPAPVGFQAPVAQVAAVSDESAPVDDVVVEEEQLQVSEHDADLSDQEAEPESDEAGEVEATEAEPALDETATEEDAVETEAGEADSEMEAVEESVEMDEAEMEAEEPEMEESASETETESEGDSMAAEEPASGSADDSAAIENAPLPVSGFGADDSVIYVLMVGVALLLVLFVGAVTATMRHRSVSE